jgi:hypothetical protein
MERSGTKTAEIGSLHGAGESCGPREGGQHWTGPAGIQEIRADAGREAEQEGVGEQPGQAQTIDSIMPKSGYLRHVATAL